MESVWTSREGATTDRMQITDYINLLAVDTQGTKDDSLKQQPQAVAPSLAGISWGGGEMGAEGGRRAAHPMGYISLDN